MDIFQRNSCAFALLLCALGIANIAVAQSYPNKSIRIIVPYPPGGNTDVMARIIAQKLNESWQQAVIVDNKPGASGIVGSEIVAKSVADGYTLLMQGTQHSINLSLYKQLPFDTLRDFAPVAFIGSAPFLLVVHPSVPANSVSELIAYIKSRPGGLNYGSSGIGGGAHLAGEIFKTAAGVQLTHIAYKGAAPAMVDLLGGQLPMVFDPIPTSIAQVRGGKLKALAITSARRSALMPELPTVAESGLPGFEVVAWASLFAPAATAKDIVTKLNAEVNRILQLPEIKEKFAGLGAESNPMTTDRFALHLRAEIAKFAKAIKDSGATAE
jgi:tripartite-type tricarboxylate transporter receptor subunit TctC